MKFPNYINFSTLTKINVKQIVHFTWQAFKDSKSKVDTGQALQLEELNKIRKIQLTRTEFAESLGLKPTSVFVRNMFLIVDKDKNGFVGFEEFLDLFQILASGMVKKKQFNYVLSF